MAREQRRALVLQQQQQQQWQAKGSTTVASSSSGSPGKFKQQQQQQQQHQQHQQQQPEYEGPTSSSSSSMRDPLARTKVVVRRLPPTLSKEAFVSQIDAKYAGTYSWLSFHSGKSTSRKQVHSRAYLDFKHPEDVYSFHEGFHAHVFVSEKGSQYKAMVEYAPFQRVPDFVVKKDGREGTIAKDPDYIAFCENLAKPVELLPSAEVQLERRESERQGTTKEPIVTALMEFVRQKRAHQKPSQRASGSKGYRSGVMGPAPNFSKRKTSSDGSKENYGRRDRDGGGRKRRDDYKEKKAVRDHADNGTIQTEEASLAGSETVEVDGFKKDYSKRKLPAREKGEGSSSGYASRNRPPVSPAGSRNLGYRPARGKDAEATAERKAQRRADGDPNLPDNGRVRNKDRPDFQIWTPRRRLDVVQGDIGDSQALEDRSRPRAPRDTEPENDLDGRNGCFENGIYRGRKAGDDSSKHGKRGAAPNEKQVWVVVQKSGSSGSGPVP